MEKKKFRPSNGTEGEIFVSQWCGTCTKDLCANGTKPLEDCADDELCSIVAKTHAFDVDDVEYPKEWVYGENGPCCTAHELMENKYKYKEAFTLMIYRCAACAHTEIMYNDRDGAAPCSVACPTCNPHNRLSGHALEHVAWDADWQVPDFQPPAGMGVWIGEPGNPVFGRVE